VLDPPFVVQEVETNRLLVLDDLGELRRLAEEFWDIWTVDFRAWDSRGQRLDITEAFLNKLAPEPLVLGDDLAELSSALTSYSVSEDFDEAVLERIRSQLKPARINPK
jgi:hypothetical protein